MVELKNIYKALASFQAEVPTINKNAKGYGYKFADLEEINKIIKPLLKKHGLGYAQPIEGSTIKTIIFHTESGETVESSTDIPQGVQLKGMNDFQVLGSAITYLRRYSLSSMLGLVTDEDADASGEQTGPAEWDYDLRTQQLDAITAIGIQLDYSMEAINKRIQKLDNADDAKLLIKRFEKELDNRPVEDEPFED